MNEPRDERIHESEEEARAGSTPGIARYVLVISTLLVVIVFAILLAYKFY